jgi:hypothetical protein
MNLAVPSTKILSSVRAELNYMAPSGERPRTYAYDPPPGVPRTTIVNASHVVEISDARPILHEVTLDDQGFDLVRHRSGVGNFYAEDEVKHVYYPEAERLLEEATGAQRVVIFDHTVRRRIAGTEDRRSGVPSGVPRQPVPRVHVDHTAKSGPQRVRDILPDEAEALLRGRVQIINLWRPLRGPLQDMPLAVCDARSVRPDQLVASDLVYPQRVGETYSVLFHPDHRWFYVPRMEADEVLLLKCYDSQTDGRARFLPHSAFADPTTAEDAPPRESIELRALVFGAA